MDIRFSRFSAVLLLIAACFTNLNAQQSPLITTFAGSGQLGFSGDGGNPQNAEFQQLGMLSVDPEGRLLIADDNRIRRVTSGNNPVISTVAGNGQPGFSGDGGDPLHASLYAPNNAITDSSGNMYISDPGNFCIRKVTFGTSPTITTAAGTCRIWDYSGDGGDPRNALVGHVGSLAISPSGDLYFSDDNGRRIRRITFGAKPIITTVAGNGTWEPRFDGVDPMQTGLEVAALAFDSSGNLYASDPNANQIRKITFGANPVITTVVGNGVYGFGGDNGDPIFASLSTPLGIAFDAADQLFIADRDNHRIRKVTFGTNPVITTVAGNGTVGFSGDNRDPFNAALASPIGVATDSSGNLYISDRGNSRIRLVTGIAAKKTNYANNIVLSITSTRLTYPGSTNVVVAVTGTPTPTGNVDLYDGSSKLATLYLQGDGKAYWYVQPGLSAGSHAISAKYNGDAKNPAGQSAPVTVNVDPVPVNFGVACWSASTSSYQCTVNVSSNAGAALGSIKYTLDSNAPVSLPLSWGNAQFTLTSPGIGNHTLALQYPEQGNFAASQVRTQTFISSK